jgi:hypothetical protein
MSDLLASDADRERIAEQLRAAAGEGRLTAEELEARLERALSARTEAELAPLVADLPSPPAPAPRPESRRRLDDHARAYIGVSLLLLTIWALTGAGYFWPIWPILGWGIAFVMPGCHSSRVGSAADALEDLPARSARRAGCHRHGRRLGAGAR